MTFARDRPDRCSDSDLSCAALADRSYQLCGAGWCIARVALSAVFVLDGWRPADPSLGTAANRYRWPCTSLPSACCTKS